MGQYWSSLNGTLTGLSDVVYSTGANTDLVGSIEPTINFMYNNLMTNPIFYCIVILVLVVSVFSFSD